MQTPIELDFHGLKANDELRECIARHVSALEERFGRITACRVAIKPSSERRRGGGAGAVAIRLTLPQGREIDIRRAEASDADLIVALNDAFKRARRRLQDQARRLRGQVKIHEDPPTARVKTFDDSAGFGFLETPDGREVYFHRNSVLNGGGAQLAPGARVRFCEEMGDKGPQASTVRVVRQHASRP